jgi:hypothetical protein
VSTTTFDDALTLARKDDPACAAALARGLDPEVGGELLLAVLATGTPAAYAAVSEVYADPLRRGVWQGFKRTWKLLEARLLGDDAPGRAGAPRTTLAAWAPRDADPPLTPADQRDAALFALQLHVIDRTGASYSGVGSRRTREYLQRRGVRLLKRLGLRRPRRFRAVLGELLPRFGAEEQSTLLGALLRDQRAGMRGLDAGLEALFVAPAENPFVVSELPGLDLLDLRTDELLRAPPAAPATPVATAAPPGARREVRPRFDGPRFAERWIEAPAWLLELLARSRHPRVCAAIARLLRDRVAEADLLAVELDRLYELLRHPTAGVWTLALGWIARRARGDRLRWGELALLVDRARRESPAALADLLAVLDDPRAEAEWAGLAPSLRDAVVQGPEAPGVGPVVDFLRRRLADRLGPPLFGWTHALALVGVRRPDVRALGRDLVTRLADREPLDTNGLLRLLSSPLPEDDPELVHHVLVRPGARPGGYRPEALTKIGAPPPAWPLGSCAQALDELPEWGFRALRRSLLAFEDEGGLDAAVARALVDRDERRTRQVGLELLGGALRRGAVHLVEVPRLLRSRHEDVVVWARERLEAAAAAGALPNEAIYRVLDDPAADVQAFGRALVRTHVGRFDVAELVCFCAESPDAATADLGIALWEEKLRGEAEQGYDLRRLVPMVRVLLYRPAQARREKENLYRALARWSVEQVDHARLVVDVLGELRRSASRIDATRVIGLLARVKDRFPEVALPFTTTARFGATLEKTP